MIFGSVCSGIEAASVAWKPLGWRCSFVSEIDPFACGLLAHHYPEVPNLGDFTTIEHRHLGGVALDVLVGGTPCQDFSCAGLRAGLAGDRGGLTVEFARLTGRLRPRWLVWENVPGVLSVDDGAAFGLFLGILAELGYGTAYRVLDAQHFGVPQRRRRVFVVGCLGDWRRAAAVLFERESLSWDSTPGREARADLAGTLGAGSPRQGWRDDLDRSTFVPVGAISSSDGGADDNDARNGHLIAFGCKDYGADANDDLSPTLRSMNEVDGNQNGGGQIAVAFTQNSRSEVRLIGGDGDGVGALAAGHRGVQQQHYLAFQCHGTNVGPMGTFRAGNGDVQSGVPFIAREATAVRRLTPRECERLQGFPDDYTLTPDPRRQGKMAADQPRYHALGNSFAVPVVAWVGRRIQMVEEL